MPIDIFVLLFRYGNNAAFRYNYTSVKSCHLEAISYSVIVGDRLDLYPLLNTQYLRSHLIKAQFR